MVRTNARDSLPALYEVDISHRRRDPIEYGFTQRGTTWLIDLDRVPRLGRGFGWLASFRSRDHLGDPRRSLRENLDTFLAEHGVPRPSAILMLANPRVLGYVFNPLTVFYCVNEDGGVRTVVAEVRNTYGGRHDYLLQTDSNGKATTDKLFYVSPFYPVEGEYTMVLPPPGDRVLVSVTMRRGADRPFVAVMSGQRSHGAHGVSLVRALRTPLATRAVMFGIKRHGIRLYVKGLRPYPRACKESVSP